MSAPDDDSPSPQSLASWEDLFAAVGEEAPPVSPAAAQAANRVAFHRKIPPRRPLPRMTTLAPGEEPPGGRPRLRSSRSPGMKVKGSSLPGRISDLDRQKAIKADQELIRSTAASIAQGGSPNRAISKAKGRAVCWYVSELVIEWLDMARARTGLGYSRLVNLVVDHAAGCEAFLGSIDQYIADRGKEKVGNAIIKLAEARLQKRLAVLRRQEARVVAAVQAAERKKARFARAAATGKDPLRGKLAADE